MDYEAYEESLRAAKRTQLLIWLALTTEPFVYVILTFIVSQGAISCAERAGGPYSKWGFYLLACLLAVASLLVSRFFLSDRRIVAQLETGRLEMDSSSGSEDLSMQDAQLLSLSRYYLNSMLLSWGLNGCVPIGGLILLFTGGDCRTILVLSALAVALNLLSYPQLDAFIERVRELIVEEGW
jgi:uncharacterized membrane protein